MGTTNGTHQTNGAASPPLRIAIVGGGIGGLALALGELKAERVSSGLFDLCRNVEQVSPTKKEPVQT